LSEKLNFINSSFGVEYSFNPRLVYAYPAPTANILTNIANAMACVPKFYTQVLHLMNKMNLPAPFGPLAPMPPIPDGAPIPTGSDLLQTEEMEMSSSSEESELESEGERTVAAKIPSIRQLGKRPSVNVKQLIKKRLKVMLPDVTTTKKDSVSAAVRPEEVFEQAGSSIPKKMEIVVTGDSLKEDAAPVAEEGFGKLEARAKETNDNAGERDEEEEEDEDSVEFISSRELRRNRLSSSEMRKMSVFKNYESGEPSSRLYIKNLAKQTDEKALRHVFGRYVNWKDDADKLVFDVRLMTEGRMKGQAFVTLANESRAAVALADTNGFVLHDKPMVVQYARSAKLKPEPASSSAKARPNVK
jgi:U11/U12 small nuclear ribonucleoprotein SNRNP65